MHPTPAASVAILGLPAMWLAIHEIPGFGAMETNVVYPAIAIAYTLLCAPRFVRKTMPTETSARACRPRF